jgi:hypothetical protein
MEATMMPKLTKRQTTLMANSRSCVSMRLSEGRMGGEGGELRVCV